MFYRAFIGLCGAGLVTGVYWLGLSICRRYHERHVKWPIIETLLALALVPVSLFAVYPYLGANLVGAGDSYHYALQVADFVTQARSDVLPVFVGQSAFGFNGNIHTLRTAPYYTHLAGLLDFLTWHHLSFVALQNLTVVATSLLAAWGAFGASLVATGGQRIVSWLLAVIYVFSPAIVGPLALNDMFATFMATPWLVICWYGLSEILKRDYCLWPQFVAAGGLALAWYAHSPIGAWLTIVWASVLAAKTILGGGRALHWWHLVMTGLLLSGLIAYFFASISSISPGAFAPVNPAFFEPNPSDLKNFLEAEFTPFLSASSHSTIQLGWTLWLLMLTSGVLALWWRHTTGLMLVVIIGTVVSFLAPIPIVSEFLWRHVPERLVLMTTWPCQRLCPLLASGIVVTVATVLRELKERPRAAYWACCAVLTAGCGWSASEVAAINRRPGFAQLSPATYQPWFSDENIHLTHSAYDWLGELPGYFTHGWADPEFESRILNADLDVAQSGALASLALAGPGVAMPVGRSVNIGLSGQAEYLLEFAFADATAKGEITINGSGIERHYLLPRSGNALAFGSEPGCGKTIPLRLPRAGTQTLTIGATIPGVSFRAVPVHRDKLPVQLTHLIPYSASVFAAEPSFLETPRVWLFGYAATVNGKPSPVRQSPNGLAMIPVPAGKSQVVLAYPGSIFLRTCWLLSIACFAAFPWILAEARKAAPLETDRPRRWIVENNIFAGIASCYRHHRKVLLTTFVASALVSGLTYGIRQFVSSYRSYGPLRITFELTRKSLVLPEPLVTLGKTGAADCIYIKYDGPHTVRFGLDHWSYGGPLSDPIEVTYAQPHVIEIDIGGLFPASRWFGRTAPPLQGKSGIGPLILKLDGRTIMEQQVPFYPVDPRKIYIGLNPTGSSVTNDRFSGKIISTERILQRGQRSSQ